MKERRGTDNTYAHAKIWDDQAEEKRRKYKSAETLKEKLISNKTGSVRLLMAHRFTNHIVNLYFVTTSEHLAVMAGIYACGSTATRTGSAVYVIQ